MRRMHIPVLATAALLLALPTSLPARAATWTATYELQAAGLAALEAVFTFDVDGPDYRIEVRTRSRGVVGLFASSSQVTVSEGVWQAGQARPRRYRADGVFRGTPRHVAIDWRDGTPVVSTLQPTNGNETREPIATDLLPGTMDALTGLVQLSRTVADTGRCESRTRLFDARRLTQITVRTAGQEPVPAEWRGVVQGMSLRCVLESRLLGGLRVDQDPTRAREPVETTAWIARVAENAPPVPLRIELASRWWGTMRAVLIRMEPR